MRLLFFVSSLRGGGAERVLSTICNSLCERGYEIYLATNLDAPIMYEIDRRVKTIQLYPEHHLKKNVIPRYINFYKRIRNIVKEVKPDVVVSFMSNLSVHVILATYGFKIPVIASEHTTFDAHHTFFKYVSRFYVNRLAEKVVLLTHHDYEFLGTRLPNKVVIPNPISYEIFDGRIERKNRVLAAGSLDRWKAKGFGNLLKVWAKVSPLFPEWTLEIAGGGKESNSSYLKGLSEDLGISKTVCFLGFQSDMQTLLQETSVFVLSSMLEGLPMALIEAMSQGCACISFDCISGPREIITDGVSGVLVKNQDLEDMEKALLSVLGDVKFREELSRNAIVESQRFNVDKIVSQWEDLLKGAVK